MAEFLIYNKTHWMDEEMAKNLNWLYEKLLHIDADPSLTAIQKIKSKDIFSRRYSARYQPGDIVEVREDGRPHGKLEPESFLFIRIPINFKTACQFMKPLETVENAGTEDETRTLVKRRRYSIDIIGLAFGVDKTVSITSAEFETRRMEKQ